MGCRPVSPFRRQTDRLFWWGHAASPEETIGLSSLSVASGWTITKTYCLCLGRTAMFPRHNGMCWPTLGPVWSEPLRLYRLRPDRGHLDLLGSVRQCGIPGDPHIYAGRYAECHYFQFWNNVCVNVWFKYKVRFTCWLNSSSIYIEWPWTARCLLSGHFFLIASSIKSCSRITDNTPVHVIIYSAWLWQCDLILTLWSDLLQVIISISGIPPAEGDECNWSWYMDRGVSTRRWWILSERQSLHWFVIVINQYIAK